MSSGAEPEIEIRPRTGWVEINWRELYDARELLFFLAWRDVKVRYKQTALGVSWAVLQPLAAMLLFTMIFGRFAGIPSEGKPYPLYVLAGLIPWTLFQGGVTASALSLVQQQSVISKVYFPRLLVPTATFGPFLVDMLVSFGLYAVLFAWHRTSPGWPVLLLPLVIALTLAASLGLGLTLSALIVLYRDLRHTLPFLIQILFFVTPVIYPHTMLPEPYRSLVDLNPLSGLVDAHRWALLGTPFNPLSMTSSVISSLVLLVFGLAFFRRTERLIADIA